MGGLRIYPDRRDLLVEGLNAMFRLTPYQDFMRQEWDRLALRQGTIFHTTGFRRILLESFPYQCGYQALVDEDNRLCGLLPLIVGRGLNLRRTGVALPFVNQLDICAETNEQVRHILDALPEQQEKLGLSALEIRLKDQSVAVDCWRDNQENHTFILPLLADDEQTLAQASPGCRNHVRKTYKNGWFRVSFEQDQLPDFYRVYVKRMKQLGSPAPGLEFFQRFFRYLPELTTLLSVLEPKTDKVIGGMLLLKSPADKTLYYPYGANLIEYNHQYLNNFMYWEAAKYGIRCGLQALDLGRSQTGSGTYRYKSQWGAQAVPLHYLRCGPAAGQSVANQRDKFQGAIALWRRLPRIVTDPAGRWLIPYLLP